MSQTLFHNDLSDTFADAGIPFAILTVKSFEDICSNAKLFGQIIGKEQEAEIAITDMDAKLDALTTDLSANKPSYAIITLMMNTASMQKSSSIALDIAETLHMKNIAENLPSGKMPSSVPFSMEKLVELNPEYLFIVVHGTDEDRQPHDRIPIGEQSSLEFVASGEIGPPSCFAVFHVCYKSRLESIRISRVYEAAGLFAKFSEKIEICTDESP
nr:ABC transporter substrate-binding protein [Paenibacillus amylolyticus]